MKDKQQIEKMAKYYFKSWIDPISNGHMEPEDKFKFAADFAEFYHEKGLAQLMDRIKTKWIEKFSDMNGEEDRNGYFVVGFIRDCITDLTKTEEG